jgi:hypothetical protein
MEDGKWKMEKSFTAENAEGAEEEGRVLDRINRMDRMKGQEMEKEARGGVWGLTGRGGAWQFV